jgi:acyl carrier protein phosphodiesterase
VLTHKSPAPQPPGPSAKQIAQAVARLDRAGYDTRETWLECYRQFVTRRRVDGQTHLHDRPEALVQFAARHGASRMQWLARYVRSAAVRVVHLVGGML